MEPPSSSDGAAPTLPRPALEPGVRILGRYTLVRVLGHGGMGVVWLAMDESLGEQVALKFLPDVVRWDAAALAELKAETRRARALTHPNIVRIHDFVDDATAAAISMEFVDGETLSARRAAAPNGVLEVADIAPWLPELCAALDYSHLQARLVHRDLKPANVMLTRDGVVKVTDFGVARSLFDTLSRTSSWHLGGTLAYMSPQQQMGEPPAPTDDIYALGAVLHELLTGKPPFHTGNIAAQIQGRRPDSIAGRRRSFGIAGATVPRAWEETIAACLEKDPAKRPASAGEIARRLAEGGTSPGGAAFAGRLLRRLPAIAGIVALAVLIAGGVALLSARKTEPPATARPASSKPGELPFVLTTGTASGEADLPGFVRGEFGPDAMLVAWEDFKRWADSAAPTAREALGLGARERARLRYDGRESPDGKSFFVVRRAGGGDGAPVVETAGGGWFELSYASAPTRCRVLGRLPFRGGRGDGGWLVSSADHGMGHDLTAAIRSEFGDNVEIADWADVASWARDKGPAAARLLGLGATGGVVIRFEGRLLTPDGKTRHVLQVERSVLEFARDDETGLVVTHSSAPHRVLVRRLDGLESAGSVDEAFGFSDGPLPPPWRFVTERGELSGTHLVAPGDGRALILRRPLPRGVQGLALQVRGNLSDALLGMRQVLRLVAENGAAYEVRVERPPGVRPGLRVLAGPKKTPILVRALASAFGEFEFRVVVGDHRVRVQIADAGGVEQFSEVVVIDGLLCRELVALEWETAGQGSREAWLERVALRAE